MLQIAETVDEFRQWIGAASEYLRANGLGPVDVAVILGSGLSDFYKQVDTIAEWDYKDIKHMPVSNVSGHAGKLVYGKLGDVRLLCFAGRIHGYEGYPFLMLSFFTHLAHALGSRFLIVTNAAGGARPGMGGGSVMLVTDHVNLSKNSILSVSAAADPYIDSAELYSKTLGGIIRNVAQSGKYLPFFEGTYAFSSGPTYETASEVQVGIKLGVDAFGMSSVPEIYCAKSLGLEAACMSLITNLASGISAGELNHDEVKHEANLAGPRFQEMLKEIVHQIGLKLAEAPGPAAPAAPAAAAPSAEASGSTPTRVTRRASQQTPAGSKKDSVTLVQPVAIPLLHAELEAAARAFERQLGTHGLPTTLVVFSRFQGAVNPALLGADVSVLARIPLKTFPSLPATSRSARESGSLALLSNGFMVLDGLVDLGLSAAESQHILRVFACAGGQRVIQICVGASEDASPSSHIERVVVADEIIDFSLRSPLTPADGFSRASVPAEVNLSSLGTNSGKPCILSFPGPELPTRSERMFGDAGHIEAYTLETSVFSDTAAHLGLRFRTLCIVSPATTRGTRAAFEHAAEKALAAVHEHLARAKDQFSTILPKSPEKPAKRAKLASPEPRYHALDLAFMNGSFDEVEAAAAHVASQLSFDRSKGAECIAVVVDSDLVQSARVAAGLTQDGLRTLAFENVPHMPRFPGTISFSEADKVIVIEGTVPQNMGHPAHETTFTTRVLKHLGVLRVIFVASGAVATSANAGILRIADHVLLDGLNPLLGHNEDRWGTRFPDMSNCYYKPFTSKLTEIFARPEFNLGSNGYRVGKVGYSEAALPTANQRQLADKLFATPVLVGSVISRIIIARHLSLRLGGIIVDVEHSQDPSALAAKLQKLILVACAECRDL